MAVPSPVAANVQDVAPLPCRGSEIRAIAHENGRGATDASTETIVVELSAAQDPFAD